MITTGIAIFLMVAALTLALYTFFDNENRLYGNIVSCGICWIICFMLAMMYLGRNNYADRPGTREPDSY